MKKKRGKGLQKYLFAFDEGYGTAYERFAFDRFASALVERYEISEVLEMPADGIMGVPGLKSAVFAAKGCGVTVAHPSAEFLKTAGKIWAAFGFVQPKPEFVRSHWQDSAFRDDSFDLVWNFCVYEHFPRPEAVVKEMLRVTRRYIFLEIQNVFNLGLPFHRAYHYLRREPWDHGNLSQMKISGLKEIVEGLGAVVLETGATDLPPWPDINIKAAEMLKREQSQKTQEKGRGKEEGRGKEKGREEWHELRPAVKLKPLGELLSDLNAVKAAGEACPKDRFALLLFRIWYNLIEKQAPSAFKTFVAHHPYLIAEKVGKK